MKVLVTGTESCGIDRVTRLLAGAGHEVYSCDDRAAADVRCNRCAGDRACPGSAGLDVIVAVREHPLPHLTSREQFVGCPLLDGLPLVVAGAVVLNPYGRRATALVERYDDIEPACRAVTARA